MANRQFIRVLLIILTLSSSLSNAQERDAESSHAVSSFKDFMDKYCMRFKQISPQAVATEIRDMESSPYPVDRYFDTPQCQPEGYSSNIKSPLLHTVADDPNAREKFLHMVFAYYAKKRKQPELFSVAVNSKNTKGETLLDYVESLRVNGKNSVPEQIVVIKKIIDFTCEHGGTYSAYKNLSC